MISVDINQLEQGIFSGYFVLNHYLTTKQWLSNPSTIFHFKVAFAVTLTTSIHYKSIEKSCIIIYKAELGLENNKLLGNTLVNSAYNIVLVIMLTAL